MRLKQHGLPWLAVYLGLAAGAWAQTSSYSKMSVVGDWQNWDPRFMNTALVSNNTWEGIYYLYPSVSNRYKFVANLSWSSTNWGDTNQTSRSLPIEDYADIVTGSGGDIVQTNITYGKYKFLFNDASRWYRIEKLYDIDLVESTNLLRNSSFEDASTWAGRAQYWDWLFMDTHGATWGHVDRQQWRAHSGSYEAAIEGQWSSWDDNFGGWWQEVPAVPGLTYQASAWFWADTVSWNKWTADVQQLKIEFVGAYGGYTAVFATNLNNQVGESWKQIAVRGEAPPGTVWARLVVTVSGAGPKGALQFDDTELRPISTRVQNFNMWLNNTNDGRNARDDWVVCTGKTVNSIIMPDGSTNQLSRSGYAASLRGSATATNYLSSPLFADGLGTISFWYRHGTTDTSPPMESVSFAVEKTSNGTDWVSLGTVSNILSTTYAQYYVYVYEPGVAGMRIRSYGSTNRLLIDDVNVALPTSIRNYQDFNDWTPVNTNGCLEYGGWYVCTGMVTSTNALEGPYCARISPTPASNNYLRSPLFSNGVGEVSYWYRHQDGTNPITCSVQTSTDGVDWVHQDRISSFTNDDWEAGYTYLYITNPVYVRILHESGDKALMLDSIYVDTPSLTRVQTFDDWPTENSYGWYRFQGWTVYTGIINSTKALWGQCARLRDTVGAHSYIQTPYFPDGLGSITFYCARYSLSGTEPVYEIQISSNGTSWTTVDTLTITSTNYAFYTKYLYETNHYLARIYHTSGAGLALFDVISVDVPSPPADVVMYGWHTPSTPYTNDAVSLNAYVVPQYGAESITLTSYYRVGTSGVFSPISMVATADIFYTSVTSIPPKPSGTVVQYYMRSWFGGKGSETNSPKYWPVGGPTNPITYYIPRNIPGKIWMNEINYYNALMFDDDTNEFVEICGPAGFDVTGWRVEFYVSFDPNLYTYYASYTLPAGTVLSNDVNGFGFYVLGDQELIAADLHFTHTNDFDYTQISDGGWPSGVRLYNEGGGVEQSVSYRGPIAGFNRIYAQEDYDLYPDPYSLQLAGSGTYYTNFNWATNDMTPGAVNVDQTLGSGSGEIPTNIWIFWAQLSTTNVTIKTQSTNGWSQTPYYSTNLLGGEVGWLSIGGYSSSQAGGTNTIWFGHPVAGVNCYFRVKISSP